VLRLDTETEKHAAQLKGDCSYYHREVQAVHRSQDQVVQTATVDHKEHAVQANEGRSYSHIDQVIQAAVDHKEHAVQANEGRSYSHTDQVIQTVADHNEHAVRASEGGSYSHKEVHAISHMQDRSIQTETAKEQAGQLGGHHSHSGNVVPASPITDQCIDYEYSVCHTIFSLSLSPMLT
jgi:hypothetical protein